jgi:hypothetical protein
MATGTSAALSLALLLVASTMVACGDDGSVHGDVLGSDGGYVLVGAEDDGNNIAGVGYFGRVEVVGVCLGIDGRTIIWPHGTEILSERPLEIDVPELGPVSVGDKIEGGGTDWSAHRLPTGIDAVPKGCPAEDLFASFYAE